MTLTALIDLIKNWTGPQGEAYVTDYSDVTDVVNRESKRFAAETLCLYSDNITFALTASTSKYSLRDTAVFSKMVVQPANVWVYGNLKAKVASVADMAGIDEGYHALDDSEPTYWYTMPPNHLVLRPAPASAYSDSRVAGWYFPDDVTFPDEGDTDPTIEFPDDVVDALAVHIAIALLAPRATGDLLERVNYLRQLNQADKARIKAQADRLLVPAPIRRATRNIYSLG